jgi:hypothetical protein
MTAELPNKLTNVYIKIRDKRAEIKRAFDAENKKLEDQQNKVKIALLSYCKEQGVESVKTTSGTFYRTVKTRFWSNDWSEMHKFVLAKELPEFFEKRLNQTAVREYIEENPDAEIASLEQTSEYQITVRKA